MPVVVNFPQTKANVFLLKLLCKTFIFSYQKFATQFESLADLLLPTELTLS